MTHQNHGLLITSTQAGQLLGVSGRTVLRMAERGELTVVQKMPGPQGACLFDSEEVQRKALDLVVKGQPRELDLGLPKQRAS